MYDILSWSKLVIGTRQVVYLLFNFTQNNTVHTYKCHIIQYGLFFSVACLTREDLIALSGIIP